MKKILFVIPSLRSGGAEKSLITLLTLFDYNKYDVDLLIFRHDGLFISEISDKVNVIKRSIKYEMFDGDAKEAFSYFIKHFNFLSAYRRYKYSKAYKFNTQYDLEKMQWHYLSKQLPAINKEYDCAIAYLEGNASRFVAEYPHAKRKICYVHNDIKQLQMDKKSNSEIFKKCNAVVTVSDKCLKSLYDDYQEYSEKFTVIENITSPTVLEKQAQSEAVYDNDTNSTVILTVGRLFAQKAVDLEVETCAELKKRGIPVKWYHIGIGPLKDDIEKIIEEQDVSNEFFLLGERANPYPYFKQCDIYVQTSRFEGKSIAIDEAKCLACPIVTTDFTTVFDQIEDGKNGIICSMNSIDIADGIEKLIHDDALRNALIDTLKKEKSGNEKEIEKLYKLIEG